MLRICVILGFFFSAGVQARAGLANDVATGLWFAGFDVIGSPNPLSGGADLLITRQFSGNVFDFGATELTLSGPVSLQVSSGGRVIPQFDVDLSTAVNSRSPVAPMSYSLVTDWGPQLTSVSGSTLIDASVSINALGFYDITVTSSTRRTVQRDGIIVDETTVDSDLGPLTLSGNVFLDALEAVTDPLFEQAGRENPFEILSKRLIELDAGAAGLLSEITSEADPVGLERIMGTLDSGISPGGVAGSVVPEPPVLILLLLGLPVVIHRGIRRL